MAEPVLLKLKNSGLVFALYPILPCFNYVVTEANIDGKVYMMDAKYPFRFGKYTECYNGHARKKQCPWIC